MNKGEAGKQIDARELKLTLVALYTTSLDR